MGRRAVPNEDKARRKRGGQRGHGSHHRPGYGKSIGTGKDRTADNIRYRRLTDLAPEELADLNTSEKRAEVERRIERGGEAAEFGAQLEGEQATGVVVEVRKGNFLTRITSEPSPESHSKRGDVLRTIVRGVMQQFDLGLSSLVAAGDEVELVIPPMAKAGALHQYELHGVLTRVLPRKSEFRRVHASGRAIQTLAANVNQVVAVASCAEPEFRPGFVDRVLVCAAASNLRAAIVVNKMDLGIDPEDAELFEAYRKLGYPVFLISLQNPQAPQGDMAQIKAYLANARTILTGHSGVGKSSLLLALDPAIDAQIVRTGEISTQTGKGTHTTTHARLFEVQLGAGPVAEVIDTPGVREFTPADTDRRNLWGWFPEISARRENCAFPNCAHLNEKGCAILAAVESGDIHPRRHESYVRIYNTLPH